MHDSPFFPSESDVLLYSNEVEFTLPVPEEILSALHKPKGDEDDDLEDDDAPARELLLVAERVIPESGVTEQSGIEKLSLKSVVSKLQTIPEDQQLDTMVTEADVENMENVPSTEHSDTAAEPPEEQSCLEFSDHLEEQTDATVVDEHIPVVENEAGLQNTPHDESLLGNDASGELVFDLDAAIFRDREESGSAKDANLGPLEEETKAEEIETQLFGRGTSDAELGEHSNVDKQILENERTDDDSLDQQENDGNGLSKEVPDQNEVTYQATNGNDKTEVELKLDNEAGTFGTERISEQSDSDFWDHGRKQHKEEIVREETVTPAKHSDVDGHSPSHELGQNDVECHAAGFQEHLDIKTHDSDTGKRHNGQELGYSEGLDQATSISYESQARDNDVVFDTNDDELITELISERNEEENDSPDKDNSSSDLEEALDKRNDGISDENSKIDETIPSAENLNSFENQTMANQELKSEHFTSGQEHSTDHVTNETKRTTKEDKETCNEVSKDTWSASSNLGSVKNENDDNKDEMETTDMPSFEEAAFEVHSNKENNEGLQQVDKEHENSYSKRNEQKPSGDSLQGEIGDSGVVLYLRRINNYVPSPPKILLLNCTSAYVC